MSHYSDPTAWRTMNWIRMGSQVFMVQQEWKLYKTEDSKTRRNRGGYGYAEFTPFPTDNWRIVNLKDVVPDDDLRELMEARPDGPE